MPAVVLAVSLWAVLIAVIDGWKQRVPNALLLLALIPAVLTVAVLGHGVLGADVVSSGLGLLVAFGLLLPGYVMGWVGAGDVKLAAVLGLLSGFPAALYWLLYAALVLGVMALVAAGLRYRYKTSWKKIPAAVAIIAAFLGYLYWGRLGIVIG